MRYAYAAFVLVAMSLCRAENRLRNSGFESGRGGGLRPWQPPEASGVAAERVAEAPAEGQWAVRLTANPAAELNWYLFSQELPVPRVEALTLSAQARAEGVVDGHGAYVSLNFFGADGKRISWQDSPQPLRGDTAWTRLATTAKPPPGASTLKAILVLHGHGTAYFDAVQLEVGTTPSDYAPSPADTRARAQDLRWRDEATAFLQAAGWTREAGRNVALLAEVLPCQGAATGPEELAVALAPAGYRVTRLQADQLANPEILSASVFDVLMLPCGEAFPASAHEALLGYLASGGCFLSVGGYAFDRPLVKADGQWLAPDRLPEGRGSFSRPLAEFAELRPVAPAGNGLHDLEVGVIACPGAEGGALRLATRALRQWATWRLEVDPMGLAAGWSRTRIRARADRADTHLIVEWTEKDQSRWQALLTLSADWQELAIAAGDLQYWHDNPSVGRGGRDDRFHPEQAAGMMFGFSVQSERDGAPLAVDIDWVRLEDDPYAALRVQPPRINTHFGRIEDCMRPEPDQLGVFDPSHRLANVAGLRAAADQWALPADLAIAAEVQGLAAVCMLGPNGHGFAANRCRRVPLLESFDAAGNPRGAALALAFHYNGTFARSAWAFCGVENRDLFGRGQPLNPYLPAIVDRLLERVFLHTADAEFACYRPGESMALRCTVAALGAKGFQGEARVRVDGQVAGSAAVSLGAGDQTVCQWQAPVTADKPFIPLRFELVRDGKAMDAIDNGVVVWRAEDLAQGPALGRDGPYITFRGQRRFLVGSQWWWGQVDSVTARSPLQLQRDAEQMQRLGFHVTRSFLRLDTEPQKRLADAQIALAARHDIAVFHTPNLGPWEKDQARWATQAREIAERYRGVPNVFIDLCNEPAVSSELPGVAEGWNDFLRRTYGSEAALRAAWGPRAPAETLGAIPLPSPTDDWADQPTADLFRWLLEHHRGWWQPLMAAAKQADPSRLVSVGYLPGHGWAGNLVAPHRGGLGQDFSNRHYYGRVDEFPAQLAWIDQRLLGAPLSLGEFGARNHPGFGDLYEDEATYTHRHESIVAHAFGMGASFACSWHWRDPMEGIFPFGQVHADNVPRPVAARMAAMAATLGAVEPGTSLPDLAVLLPTEHLLGGGRQTAIRGVTRCLDTLLGLHVPFTVIADVSLAQRPPAVKRILAPIPYVLEEEPFGELVRFVEEGGVLAVTGDVQYNRLRQPVANRLARLCGVRNRSAGPPLQVVGSTTQVPSVEAFPQFQCHPSGDFETVTATALSAVVFAHNLGKGRVLFVGAPLELEAENDVPLREVYARLVTWLGAARLQVMPDLPEVHASRIEPAAGPTRYLLWNEGPARRLTVTDARGEHAADVGARTWALLPP